MIRGNECGEMNEGLHDDEGMNEMNEMNEGLHDDEGMDDRGGL